MSSSPSRAPVSTNSKKPASKTTTKKPMSKKPASKAKAAAKPKVAPKAKVSKTADTTTGRPSWKDIIKVCYSALRPYLLLNRRVRNVLRLTRKMLVKVFLGIPSKE